MRLLKFFELSDFARALIKVYVGIMTLVLVLGVWIAWLGDGNSAFIVVVSFYGVFAFIILFVYLMDCYLHIED